MDFTVNIQRILLYKNPQTDLHSKDESLIDTKGLLRGDQQRGDASERAREEEALIINLSNNNLVREIQHPVGECTHTIPITHRKTQSDQGALSYVHISFFHSATFVGKI